MSNILRLWPEQGPGRSTEVLPMEAGAMLGVVGRALVEVRGATYAMYPKVGANNVTQLPQQPAGAGTIPGEGLVFGQPAAEATAPQQPTGPTDVRDIALRASEQAAAIQAAQMSVENAHREAA
jgi:hypothetical protein